MLLDVSATTGTCFRPLDLPHWLIFTVNVLHTQNALTLKKNQWDKFSGREQAPVEATEEYYFSIYMYTKHLILIRLKLTPWLVKTVLSLQD
jgi:hypothetical protein